MISSQSRSFSEDPDPFSSGSVFVSLQHPDTSAADRHRIRQPDNARNRSTRQPQRCLFHCMNDTFYNSARWRKHARAIMSRDGYRDQVEARYGRAVPAELVHHILPLQEYPEHAWTEWNLISISRATHNRLHLEDGSLSLQGWRLADRVARLHGVRPPERPQGRNNSSRSRHYDTK